MILLAMILGTHLSLKKKTSKTADAGIKDVEIMVPLKYLSNFWRILEMSLNYCKNNLILTWSANFLILSNAAENQGTTFAIADNKLRVPVVTLSTGGYAKLLLQLK